MVRLTNPDATRRKLLSERQCRICEGPAATGHHLYPRGQGGDDVPENLIPLCGSGTSGCHGRVEGHDRIARMTLACHLRPEESAYLERKLGGQVAARAWLGRFYYVPEEAWRVYG